MFLAISILYRLISAIYLRNIPEIKYVVMKKIVMVCCTSTYSYVTEKYLVGNLDMTSRSFLDLRLFIFVEKTQTDITSALLVRTVWIVQCGGLDLA
jgi:hypothetical protein